HKNGSLDPEEPVHVFWIRYGENGEKEELNFIQRKFAYGIKSRLISKDKYELNFVSYKKFPMYLMKGANNKFNVYGTINQKQAIVYVTYKAILNNITITAFAGYFLLGVFVWTAAEYVLHRYLFHFVPKSEWGLRLHFIFHGVHHDYPRDAKRLVMVPSVSIPLAVVFYLLFSLFLSHVHLFAFFPGFVAGYLAYDMTH